MDDMISSSFNRLSFMTTKSITVDNIQQPTTKPNKANIIQVDSSIIEDSSNSNMNIIQNSNCEYFIDVQLDKSNASEADKERILPYIEIEEKEIKKDLYI